MKDLIVEVKPREQVGKNESRRLRRAGEMPAVVYGADKSPVPICVDPDRIVEILHSESGANTIFQLSLAGEERKRHVMIKDYQVDPVEGRLIHADFLRIQMDEVIEVNVPIQFSGEATGVKLDGGILDHVTREVAVSCLPGDIPEHITIDVTSLKIGDNLTVENLPSSDRYKILSDPGQTLVVCSAPAKEEEAAVVVEEEVAPGPGEPELIKKGKPAEGTEEAQDSDDDKKQETKKPEGKK